MFTKIPLNCFTRFCCTGAYDRTVLPSATGCKKLISTARTRASKGSIINGFNTNAECIFLNLPSVAFFLGLHTGHISSPFLLSTAFSIVISFSYLHLAFKFFYSCYTSSKMKIHQFLSFIYI